MSQSSFQTTRWTIVIASGGEGREARQALSELCSDYYGPVVGFLRAQGFAEHEARDKAHDFFVAILDGSGFRGARPEKGKFRSYLLGALRNFLINQKVAKGRLKRGGHLVIQSMNADPEKGPLWEPADHHMEPVDASFEREWAITVVTLAVSQLQTEQILSGNGDQFSLLKDWLSTDCPPRSQADVAQKLGMSEGAIKVAIHRLRKRFRELVRGEVARTVGDPSEVDAEMKVLLEALSRAPEPR